MIDDHMETMSMTSIASEAPIEADKYDLQFDINEEEKILTKIKGLHFYFKINIKSCHSYIIVLQLLFKIITSLSN